MKWQAVGAGGTGSGWGHIDETSELEIIEAESQEHERLLYCSFHSYCLSVQSDLKKKKVSFSSGQLICKDEPLHLITCVIIKETLTVELNLPFVINL